ncbi:MAG TPA: glycosyltransferase [Candidatus Levybacteria bacterium]|nr:glycosyltransferase [Candidatus Levybacteria bacterium]
MKVALVYDRINKWGGAERLLLLLHEMFPDAPVFTSVYDPQAAPWAKDLTIRTSFLEHIPYARRHHEFFALLMPLAFESFNFDEFDLVISLTSEAAKGIITRPHTKHMCICLTPTRYLWSEYNLYFANEPLRTLSLPLVWYLRKWDLVAASRPDFYVSISQTVSERIQKYYGKKSNVIYPPLLLKSNKHEAGVASFDYFLVVSRLSRFTPQKRVELAIKAANKLKVPLIVVGDGDVSYYKKIAGRTVSIVGKVTDYELVNYYKNCKALIFPGVEDFGLVMVEAQSFGRPAIAFREGGALEIIQEGKTGEFFDKPTVSSLVNTLKLFDKRIYNSKDCIMNATRFKKDTFMNQIHMSIQKLKKMGGKEN